MRPAHQITSSIWLLDDFTPGNGATRVVPGSHRWAACPRTAPAAIHAACIRRDQRYLLEV